MRFCQNHWDQLRQKIDDRAMAHLVAKSGEVAVQQMVQQLQDGKGSRESFDPLMEAHWAIVNNIMQMISDTGNDPLYLMTGGPEDPVDHPQYTGRTWPRCPLCYISLAHEISCTNPRCKLPKENGYDWMLDLAADDALQTARDMKLVGPPS